MPPHLSRAGTWPGVRRATPADDVELYHRIMPIAMSLAQVLLGDAQQARDIAHDVYIKMLTSTTRVSSHEALGAYLRTAIIRHIQNMWRAEGRSTARALRSRMPEMDSTSAHGVVESRVDLVQAVRSLPEKQRMVITLSYFLDYSEADIAAATGMRPGTIKSTRARALETLRKEYRYEHVA